jgi:benzaldehyde dehydrogenase (NAD)
VVLDDADLDEAAKAAAFGGFVNQGQVCMSTERIVVDETVADAFTEKLAALARQLATGDSGKGGVACGSLVNADAAARVRALIDDALSKGARLVAGDEGRVGELEATVLDRVTPAMRIYGEETFGPVVVVLRAQGVDDAVQIANDTDYGLSAAVFGRDVTRALAVARRIEAGHCCINAATVPEEPQLPLGATKASGYGGFGGKAAIDHFTELRTVTIATGKQEYPPG